MVLDIFFYSLILKKYFSSECISSRIECTLGNMCSAITNFVVPQKSGNSFFVVVRITFFIHWNNIALGQAYGNQIDVTQI